MSREIKFRAWDKKKNKMFYPGDNHWETRGLDWGTGNLYVNLSGVVLGFMTDDGGKNGLHEHEYGVDVELMQYTGLKDRNGKEIYEGDVLLTPAGNIVGVVEYSTIRGGYEINGEGQTSLFLGNNHSRLEVAGNIYKNPELLETD